MTDNGLRASRPQAAGTEAVPTESAAARLVALLDHLGLARAHVATQIPADIAELAANHPDRLGGIVLCAPVRLDPTPFAQVADRLLMISGEYGPTFDVTVRAADRLPGAERHIIDNYEALGWSDVDPRLSRRNRRPHDRFSRGLCRRRASAAVRCRG